MATTSCCFGCTRRATAARMPAMLLCSRFVHLMTDVLGCLLIPPALLSPAYVHIIACAPEICRDLSKCSGASTLLGGRFNKRIVVLQAWERTGFSQPWARELGLDARGMRFARDVRRQLESIAGPDGAGLLRRDGGANGGREASGGGQTSSAAVRRKVCRIYLTSPGLS